MSSLVINNTGSVLSTKSHLERDESGFVYAIASSKQYSRHLITTTKAGAPAAVAAGAAAIL